MPDDNPQEKATEASENPVIEFTLEKDRDFRSVYCNQTAFNSTAFDFAMTFGEIIDISQDLTQAAVAQHVRVVMSPLHFKIFLTVAAQNLKGYEDKFGKIAMPLGGPIFSTEQMPKAPKTDK
jgi:hypothetical protein